jgi:hypothetical protein
MAGGQAYLDRRTSMVYLAALLLAGAVLSRQVLGAITEPVHRPPGPPTRTEAVRFLEAADPGAQLLAYHTFGDVGYTLYLRGDTWGYWSVGHGGTPELGAVNVLPSGRYAPPLVVSQIWSQPSLLVAVFDGRLAAAESRRARIHWSNGTDTDVPLSGRRMGWIVASPAPMHATLMRWSAITVYGRHLRRLYMVTPHGIVWYIEPPPRSLFAVPSPYGVARLGLPAPVATP